MSFTCCLPFERHGLSKASWTQSSHLQGAAQLPFTNIIHVIAGGPGEINANGFALPRMSNVSIIVRPDGDYMIMPRSGQILISKDGILGPYKVQGPPVYPSVTWKTAT